MELTSLSDKNKKEWDNFCLKSDDAWFWHTSDWISYTLDYDPEIESENLSFFVEDRGVLKAICPLILEKRDVNNFAFGGNYTPMPSFLNDLDESEKEKIQKKIFEYIDELAIKHKVSVSKFKFTALEKNYLDGKFKFNSLLKFGFLDVSIGTQIIDLSLSLEDLKSNIRHGHKSDITKAEKNMTFEIFDKNNNDKDIFEKYRIAKVEHGSTRSKKTFDLMFEFIERGEAFLVVARDDKEIVSFSYFFVYKNNAYYGSSVNLNDDSKLPMSHGIQWQAIQYMKSIGVKHYEVGWQVYSPGLNDFSSPKEVAISKFKRGFGGEIVPLFMAEKYYDKKYLSETFEKRLNNVLESYEK